MSVLAPAQERVALAPHTSLKVGGAADYFQVARSANELGAALKWAIDEHVPVRLLGGGSNLLISDRGVEGLVVKVQASHWEVVDDDEPRVVADAGAPIGTIARAVSKRGYSGLEWAATVPGTVGGAVVNNAGAFGGDTASTLVAATIVTAEGTFRQLTPEDLGYAYRTSVLKRHELGDVAVVRVELRVGHCFAAESSALVASFQTQRSRSQPRQLSAGSVFSNPPGDFSGRLIEEAGLKGSRVGGAEISMQHANFIVNVGNACAQDVFDLIQLVQNRVFARSSVWLKPEIELFGRWSPSERAALLGPADAAAQVGAA